MIGLGLDIFERYADYRLDRMLFNWIDDRTDTVAEAVAEYTKQLRRLKSVDERSVYAILEQLFLDVYGKVPGDVEIDALIETVIEELQR